MYEAQEQTEGDQEFVFEGQQCIQLEGQKQMRKKGQNDANLLKYYRMCEDQRQDLEVYAVTSGCPVQYSGSASIEFINYMLDCQVKLRCWAAAQNIPGQWIQVSTQDPKLWAAVILQGRGDTINGDQWVTSLKISYSMNGRTWKFVEKGKIFQGVESRSQKNRIDFQRPIQARTIRLHPQTWHTHMSLRFDAIYLDFTTD